jgi:muramoyltetrapeptide carboxypeptidase
MSYTDDERQLLRKIISERTQGYSFPIITDMDFGHTAPQFTIPIGVVTQIDSTKKRFEIVENAVE